MRHLLSVARGGWRLRRGPRDVHAGAACITLIFTLLMSVLQASALTAPTDQPPPDGQGARNEAGWAQQEAERRATTGDYDGAVQAQREADALRERAKQPN